MINPHSQEKYGGIKSLCIITGLAVVSWSALFLVLYGAYVCLKSIIGLLFG